MLPSIEDGDVLHVAPARSAQLKIGDIVLFKRDGEFKAHRIVGRDKNNKEWFITRGDASMQTDRAIRAEQILGKVVARQCALTDRIVPLSTVRERTTFFFAELRRQVVRIRFGKCLSSQLIFILLLLAPATLRAQIAVDTSNSGTLSVKGTGNFSLTVSHTTSGTNRLMVVGISVNTTSNAGSTITTVSNGGSGTTCTGGTALTRVFTNNTPTLAGMVVEMWYLVAPATGSSSVCVAGIKVGGNRMGVVAGVITFTGVQQTLPIRSSAVSSGSSSTASVSLASTGADMVVDTVGVAGNITVTTPGAQAQRWNVSSGNTGQEVTGVGSTRTGALPTVTMSAGLSSSSGWAIGAISIEAFGADLAITKTASSSTVLQNATFTYTLTVKNNGPQTASAINVTDTLPSQVTFVSATYIVSSPATSGSCIQSPPFVLCSTPTLNSGATMTITITVTANTPAQITNTATVIAGSPVDPDPTNNTASVTTTIVFPTAVKLSAFSATQGSGGVSLSWKSGAELHNLGYNVYRDAGGQKTKVNPSLISGSALLMRETVEQHAAKSYGWIDRSPEPGAVYWLEDVDLNGVRTMHGPVTVDSTVVVAQPAVSRTIATLARTQVQRAQVNRASASTTAPVFASAHVLERAVRPLVSSSVQNVGFGLAAEPAVKILVDHEGWYRVTQPQLVAAGLGGNVNANLLHLYAEGVEQPMRITGGSSFGAQSAIEFYGTAIDTPYSGQRVYWLTEQGGPGLRVANISATGTAAPEAQTFVQTLELKPRTTYFAALLREDTDNFFGPLVSPASDTETIDIANLAAGEGTLDITLQGVTGSQQHDATVMLNGSTLGDVKFADQQEGLAQFVVPAGVLTNGTNTITLTAQQGSNDISLVDTIQLSFPHTYTAESDLLKFTADAGQSVTIAGFSQSPSRLIDITNPLRPVQLSFSSVAQGGTYTLQSAVAWTTSGTHTLLALSDAQLSSPVSIVGHHPSRLHTPQPGAEFVIVAAPQFSGQMQPLAAMHKAEGKSVAIVSSDTIYDEFNFGEPSPFAIRSFLKTAATVWTAKPRYLVLAGDASVDPRNYLGFGFFDFVPTRIVPTAELKTASDDWFSDFNNTGLATIATGRLPARTASDAQLMVSKIVGYATSAPGSWNTQALLVADTDDPGLSFTQAAQSVQKVLPSTFTATDVFTGVLGTSTARQNLLDGINSGQLLVNYNGHGSVEVWSGSNLFDDTMAASLTNGSKLPLFVIMNCLNGFFHDVYTQSLAESLMLSPNGGAVAVWASSGLTQPEPQFQMDDRFMQTLFSPTAPALGDAVLMAKSAISDIDVRRTFIFFGDPAMQLRIPQTSGEVLQTPNTLPVISPRKTEER